jgi:hypothetical protein
MRNSSIAAVFVMCVALSLTLVASGCGGSSKPDTAVTDFFQAISLGDWNAFTDSVLPDRIRVMSDTEKRDLQAQIKKKSERYTDLKFKVVYDKSDKNKAQVVILSGKITGANLTTGQQESMDFKDVPEASRTLNVVKFKGRWYVDIQLSSGQAQPQSATQPSQ